MQLRAQCSPLLACPPPGALLMQVVGILADGIPWEMPYRCPTLVWDPYRRTYTILIRIISDSRIVEIPLSRFLRDFSCDRPDIFKRNPEHRHIVLKDIAADPELQKRRDKNINHYPQDITPARGSVPVVQKCRHIPGTEREIKPDNSYRHYL